MENMPAIQNEVQMMLNPDAAGDPNDMPPPPERFGAKDVTDLSWKNLLDAYSCTECGRCTSACPQNITGKTAFASKDYDGHPRQGRRAGCCQRQKRCRPPRRKVVDWRLHNERRTAGLQYLQRLCRRMPR